VELDSATTPGVLLALRADPRSAAEYQREEERILQQPWMKETRKMPNPSQTQGSSTSQPGGGTQKFGGVGSPITNEAYNVVTALQAKLEGLEAYRKYSKDNGGEIWSRLNEFEQRSVELLCDELERLVKAGKFRIGSAGAAND